MSLLLGHLSQGCLSAWLMAHSVYCDHLSPPSAPGDEANRSDTPYISHNSLSLSQQFLAKSVPASPTQCLCQHQSDVTNEIKIYGDWKVCERKMLSQEENMGYLRLCTSSDRAKKPKMHHLRLSVKRIFPFILSFDCSGCAWYPLINFPGLSLHVNMTFLPFCGYPSQLLPLLSL